MPRQVPVEGDLHQDDSRRATPRADACGSNTSQTDSLPQAPGASGASPKQVTEMDGQSHELGTDHQKNRCEASGDADDTLSTAVSDSHEPAFHETCLLASVQDIMKKDSASAMAVSRTHIALGTQSGMIYVLSHSGHLEKGFRFHSAPVLDLVFDTSGEFVGSAGMDGIVAIASLTTSEQYQFDHQRPMRTIALEPHFASRSSRAFVCGGMSGVLVYREKRWFGYRDMVIHSDEGPIWTTAWRGHWLAWATDRGVRVANATTHDMITMIPTPQGSPRAELARCSLVWRDSHTLLIAHGDTITVAIIKTRESTTTDDEIRAVIPGMPTFAGLVTGLNRQAPEPSEYVEITDIFQLDCVVAGMACTPDYMATLAYVSDGTVCQAPELRCVNSQGEELSSDVLEVVYEGRYRCNDFHMKMSVEWKYDPVVQQETRRPVFYVASPRQISVLRPRDERDHIEWLLEHDEYRRALEALEALGSAPAKAMGFDVAAIGREYLMYLIDEQDDYAGAAALLPLLLRSDKAAWDSFVLLFLERHQVETILPFIPTQDPELSEVVYDLVLVHLLQENQALLLATLTTWPSHLYSTQAVAAAIHDKARNSRMLLECLAQLYMADRQPGKALPYMIHLRDASVFALIREHNLLIDVQHKIGTLVELDQELAGTSEPRHSVLMPLLVQYTHSIPIERAMQQLQPYPWYEFLYLHALFERDASLVTNYALDLLRLYCRYDYAKLMPFLRSMSSVYSLKEAYAVCEEHNYVPEMVFLRGRSGDLRGALQLILERLRDVEMAIEFVRQQDDSELWESLLAYSDNKPEFIRGLLEHASGEIDPVRMIRPIRHGLIIPGLRSALIKIFTNFHLQHSLFCGGLAVLECDAHERGMQYYASLQTALACDAHTLCAMCHEPLLQLSECASYKPLVLYLCSHTAHRACVTEARPDSACLRSSAYAAVPLHATTTDMYNRSRASTWFGSAPTELTVPSHATNDDKLKLSGKRAMLERADRDAWIENRQLYRLDVGLHGCPICTRAYRERLSDESCVDFL